MACNLLVWDLLLRLLREDICLNIGQSTYCLRINNQTWIWYHFASDRNAIYVFGRHQVTLIKKLEHFKVFSLY